MWPGERFSAFGSSCLPTERPGERNAFCLAGMLVLAAMDLETVVLTTEILVLWDSNSIADLVVSVGIDIEIRIVPRR